MQPIVECKRTGKRVLTIFLVCLLAASGVAVGSVVVPPAAADASKPSKLVVNLAPNVVIGKGLHEKIIFVSLQDASGNPAYAISDITLEMSSSNPAVGTIYAGYAPYKILKGETWKAVTFEGVYSSSTRRYATGQTTITARAPGLTSSQAVLTVVDEGGAVAKLKLYAPTPTILVNGNAVWPIVGQLLDSSGVPTYPKVGQIITAPLSSSNASVISGGSSFGFYASGGYFNYVLENVKSLAPGQANITASAAGLTGDSITITTIPAGDFSLSVSPQSIYVKPGDNIEFTVTATLISGTADMAGFPNWAVQVWWENNSGITGLPTKGVIAVRGFPASTHLTPTGTATFRFATDSNVPTGTYTITITGSYIRPGGGWMGVKRTATVALIISTAISTTPPAFDFSLSATPYSGSITQGQSTTYSVRSALTSGTAQTISLAASGLPSGASASFSPSSSIPSATSTLTITTSSSVSAGTYPITITGIGGGVTRTTSVTLYIPPPLPLPPKPGEEITVAPGAAWEGEFPAANVLELMARIPFEKVAGANFALDVSVNGQQLSAPLLNKDQSFRFADGRTFPYYDGSAPGWVVFYSPDFTANNTSAGGGYQVMTDPGQAYRYRWDISSLVGTSPTVRLRLYNNGSTSGKAIIVRLALGGVVPEPSQPVAIDLTGAWNCDIGGKFYIRQVGNNVWWYGESAPASPSWSDVAHGVLVGNELRLEWADVPKGRNMFSGNLVLKVESNNRMVAINKTGSFGGLVWTR